MGSSSTQWAVQRISPRDGRAEVVWASANTFLGLVAASPDANLLGGFVRSYARSATVTLIEGL